MKSIVALDADTHILQDEGTKAVSRVIYVRPGESALLSLHGMQSVPKISDDKKNLVFGGCISIKRVHMGEAEMKEIERECGANQSYSNIADNLIRRRVVRPYDIYKCGETWSISPCDNLKLIDVPGFYVAELTELDQLEELVLEYSILNHNQALSIQADIRLGV